MSVTDLYDKEEQARIEFELVDLNHTGSGSSGENQVVILTVPEELAHSVRQVYRERNPHGVTDFEMVRLDDSRCELYFGSSYGSKTFLGAVGECLYYSSDFGAEFEDQY
jgi:hypothetical protein